LRRSNGPGSRGTFDENWRWRVHSHESAVFSDVIGGGYGRDAEDVVGWSGIAIEGYIQGVRGPSSTVKGDANS
jgi:hypothetical protein